MKVDSPATPQYKGGKADTSGTLNSCCGPQAKAAVKNNDKLVGLDRNAGSKDRNEDIQLGSMRKNPGSRFAPNETKGVK